jgi:hypothetical protein
MDLRTLVEREAGEAKLAVSRLTDDAVTEALTTAAALVRDGATQILAA